MLYVLLLSITIYGCGSDAGSDDVTSEQSNNNSGAPSSKVWKSTQILKLENPGGLLTPLIRALVDSKENVHFIYFDDQQYPSYTINHVVWDMKSSQILTEESIIEIDNSGNLSFLIDQDDVPIVAYQGGEIKNAGNNKLADAMINIKNEDEWLEYTGAKGEVDPARNPVFTDGLAGADMSMTFDSKGDIHLCYQFRYEGVDAYNYAFPDLRYVKIERNSLGNQNTPVEETVEGNIFTEDYLLAELQNNVGSHCAITMDSNNNPVVFYYAELFYETGITKGLRVARKQGETWEAEWIETGHEIGDLSIGLDNEGRLAAAYYVKNRNYLRYAYEQSLSSWKIEMVDDTVRGGKYCSLAFDSSGLPAIAYYTEKTHTLRSLKDLRLARFDGDSWQRENIATTGDIGLYNSLWFDDNERILISTYSNTEKAIYIFYNE